MRDMRAVMEEKKIYLIQPIFGEEDIQKEISEIRKMTDVTFELVPVRVSSWNRDLSPWEAPPVYGDEPFGGGAPDTLERILSGIPDDAPAVLGGYSLAGLFALWSMLNTDRLSAIAAASPSVWFPGFTKYLEENISKADIPVYLSLGDKEPKAGKPVMRTVGDNILRIYEDLDDAFFEWNPGNHFREPEKRTAKGFAWCLERLKA